MSIVGMEPSETTPNIWGMPESLSSSIDSIFNNAKDVLSEFFMASPKSHLIRGVPAIVEFAPERSSEGKDIRYHSVWVKILTNVSPYTNDYIERMLKSKISEDVLDFEMVIPLIFDINWNSHVESSFIPPYSRGLESFDRPDMGPIKVPNVFEKGGYKTVDLYGYISERTRLELIPSMEFDPILLLLSIRLWISNYGTMDLKIEYDAIIYILRKYMIAHGFSKAKNRFFTPMRLKRGRFIGVISDSYFFKRLSCLLTHLFFAIGYSNYISALNERSVMYWAFFESTISVFVSPFTNGDLIKGVLSPILLSAGSIPQDISNIPNSYKHAHKHPKYSRNEQRDLQTDKLYGKAEWCTSCNISKFAYIVYKSIRVNDVEAALKRMAQAKLNNMVSFARIVLTENYNVHGVRYMAFWHNMQIVMGFRMTNPIVDICDTVNASNAFYSKCSFDADNKHFARFKSKLYQAGRECFDVQVSDDAVELGCNLYQHSDFKKVLPSLMTGKSAGKGGVQVLLPKSVGLNHNSVKGRRCTLRDKRSLLMTQRDSLRLNSEDFITYKRNGDNTEDQYRRIGCRRVCGRPVRAIYQQTLEEYIVESYLFTFIEYFKHPASEVISELSDAIHLGSYNIKNRLSSSDDYVCEMVEATGRENCGVIFMDQTAYDMGERWSSVLSHFFKGFLEAARLKARDLISPFVIEGRKGSLDLDEQNFFSYCDVLEFYLEHIKSRWFVIRQGSHSSQFEVDWLPSGAKYTFDLNTVINAKICELITECIREVYPEIGHHSYNIAGDDNFWVVENLDANNLLECVKAISDIIANVSSALGFRLSVAKSGLSCQVSEFAKVIGYAGFSQRIGLVSPFEQEEYSMADNLIDFFRGWHTKVELYPQRHFFSRMYSHFILFVSTTQCLLTTKKDFLKYPSFKGRSESKNDDKNRNEKKRKGKTESGHGDKDADKNEAVNGNSKKADSEVENMIMLHPYIHLMPSSTKMGTNLKLDMLSSDNINLFISHGYAKGGSPLNNSFTSLIDRYYTISKVKDLFRRIPAPDIKNASVTLVDDGQKRKVTFGDSMVEKLLLDPSIKEISKNALKSMPRMGASRLSKYAYCNLAEDFQEAVIESINVQSVALRTVAPLHKILSASTAPLSSLINDFPYYRFITSLNMSRVLSSEIALKHVVRYASMSEPLYGLQVCVGNRDSEANKAVRTMYQTFRRIITKRKLAGIIVSSRLTEEEFAQLCIDALSIDEFATGNIRSVRELTQEIKPTTSVVKKQVRRHNKLNAVAKTLGTDSGLNSARGVQLVGINGQILSSYTHQASHTIISGILRVLFGTYDRLQLDCDLIIRTINSMMNSDIILPIASGAFNQINPTYSNLRFGAFELSHRRNYRYKMLLLLYVHTCSVYIHKGYIYSGNRFNIDILGSYVDISMYGREVGGLGRWGILD